MKPKPPAAHHEVGGIENVATEFIFTFIFIIFFSFHKMTKGITKNSFLKLNQLGPNVNWWT